MREKGFLFISFAIMVMILLSIFQDNYTPESLRTQVTPVNGVCGSAQGNTFDSLPPSDLLCSTGTATTVTPTSDNKWIWQCQGTDGGTTANCQATLEIDEPQNGVCGPAQGQSFDSIPQTDLLCSEGNPTAPVEVDGKWIWECKGINDGTSVNCESGDAPTHFMCLNRQCIEVEGSGKDQCSDDTDCELVLEDIFIFSNPFNDIIIEQQVQTNGTVILTATGEGNLTWNIRGTAGGTLDSYTGNTVTYSPSDIRGQDIVSASNGTLKAFAYIEVDLSNGVPTFDIKLTNSIDETENFPLNVSLGIEVGDAVQFKALGEFIDPQTAEISYRDITGVVNWESSDLDTNVGEIFSTGLFQANNPGIASVSAELGLATSNSVKVEVNPTFPEVNPAGYEPHFHPNPIAQGYNTKLWVYVEDDTNVDDIQIVSADLSRLNITPACTENNSIESCNSDWRMDPAEFEGRGRWFFIDLRVPFTVPDGTYDIRIQATSSDGAIDRSVTAPLRVVTEVIKGDVNGDGVVMIVDAIFALQASVGVIEQSDRRINIFADVNGDGRIGLAEAIYILNDISS